MTRTHVLIDLDGTLSNSLPGISRSLQFAFGECGYEPPTDDAVRAIIGPPFQESLPRLGIAHDDYERVVAQYRLRYNDVGLFENEVYDGVPDMLTALAEAGYVLALATAKPEPVAVRITEHFGFTHHFAYQAGASIDLPDRRTKGQVITYALAGLGIDAGDHVVMLGDRDHDVEGATENSIDCIGVTWGFGSHDELAGAGAHVIVNTPGDVVAAVNGTYRSDQS